MKNFHDQELKAAFETKRQSLLAAMNKAITTEDAERVFAKCIEQAENGDAEAAKMVPKLRRAVEALRDRDSRRS